MYLEEIPFYTLFSEISDKVTEIVLSLCDTAEFLGGEGYGLQEIYDLYGTKYEDIIPAYISCESGDSWGMTGKLFRFKLTDELRKHILEEQLTCMFSDKNTLYLENLCLYSGEKVVFSCVSHEVFSLYHMAEIDDSLNDLILAAIREIIGKMPLYEKMKNAAYRLKDKPIDEIKKELRILFDLCWYVDSAKGMWICSPPKYKCDLTSFKKLAKIYFTEETYSVLLPITSYADLQPLPVARTADDFLNGIGKNTPQFSKTDYYKTVERELNMLEYILGLKNV